MVRPGDSVVLPRTGGTWQVGRLLGEGGQGRVYEIERLDRPGQALALKWSSAGRHTDIQRESVTRLVERGSPGPEFLWPLEVVVDDAGSFGYTMELTPARVVPLSHVLGGGFDISPSLAIRISLSLAHSFLKLHSLGLCYRDISFGNVLFDPETSRLLICDNDNVSVDGEGASAVLGTRRFMAPEILRGEARPSTQTDLYALAVLIFYVLMVHHPLMGRRELGMPCWDEDAEDALFARDPLFVFDPGDDSNAPDPQEHAAVLANWAMYPPNVRDLFVRAFTQGLHRPADRVRESVWRAELARALDRVVGCPDCGSENFFHDDVACWLCGAAFESPPRLTFAWGEVLLGPDTRLYQHHLRRDYNVETVIAQVARHPRLDRWGLSNASDFAWTATVPGRPPVVIRPGQKVALVANSVINFGSVPATIGT